MSFVNNIHSTLSASISSTANSIQVLKAVAPLQDPPESGKLTLIDDLGQPTKIEIITYTGRVDTGTSFTLTGVSRGQEGSTAASFGSNTTTALQAFTAQDAFNATPLLNPAATYVDGRLTRMDYAGGVFKVFTYNEDETPQSVTLTNGSTVSVKTINWIDGVFQNIT